jgi:hypothetical protein
MAEDIELLLEGLVRNTPQKRLTTQLPSSSTCRRLTIRTLCVKSISRGGFPAKLNREAYHEFFHEAVGPVKAADLTEEHRQTFMKHVAEMDLASIEELQVSATDLLSKNNQ